MSKQERRVLQYMQDFGSITPMEAIKDLGIMRLASRISDLRRKGYLIERTFEKGENRYGEPTKWARYILKGEI